MTPRLVLLTAALCSGSLAPAADWPQWQGPDRNSMSKETGLLQEWPQGGPPLAWKVKGLGGGDSAPSVAAGQIYVMGTRGSGDNVVRALSEKDGKEVWVAPVGSTNKQAMNQSQEGPGCTPTVDGDKVYALGMSGDLVCLQAKDGKEVWKVSLTKEFGGVIPMWSYRESPLIDGDKLICTPGGPDATLAALDKKTGKTLWKAKVTASGGGGGGGGGRPAGGGGRPGGRPGGFGGGGSAAYSSPIAIDFGGQRQYVQFTAQTLVGVSADDGKVLWAYDKPANGMGINISTPIHTDGQVFAASAYGKGGGLVKLTKGGDGVKAEEVYFTKKMENHHGGMIVHDGYLYGANGGNSGGFLICLDYKTGEVKWDQRDAGGMRVAKGSVAFADGRIYYRTEAGAVLLIEPNPKEYVEKGRFDQPDRTRSPAWAHPVVANGKLYIRDQDTLYCYDVKAK